MFSFESEEIGRDGQRKYLVTTYYEFGQRYMYVLQIFTGLHLEGGREQGNWPP